MERLFIAAIGGLGVLLTLWGLGQLGGRRRRALEAEGGSSEDASAQRRPLALQIPPGGLL